MASSGLYEAKAPPPVTSSDAEAYSDNQNQNPASTAGTPSSYPADQPATNGHGTGAFDQAAFDANNGVSSQPPPPPPQHPPAHGTGTNTIGHSDENATHLGTGSGTAPPARSATTADRAKALGQRGYDQFVKPGRENKGLGPEHNVWLALLGMYVFVIFPSLPFPFLVYSLPHILPILMDA